MDPTNKLNKDSIEIMIVEDSVTQAEKLRFILETEGYKVNWISDGKKALDILLQGSRPAIIVSDVMMPEMTGFELCAEIKKNPDLKEIPVVLLTTLSEPEDIMRGLACGADNFLTKPYERQFLLSRIDYIQVNQRLRHLGMKSVSEMGIDILFGGNRYYVTSDRMQIIDLLLSAYDTAVQKAKELERTNRELLKAIENIKTLHGLIPICANCKKIRNDQGYWQQVEEYIHEHSDADFSHSICPECIKKLYPNFNPG